MKSLKPLVLSFSLLAFTGAYAQDAKKERDPTAKPAMSQAETKDDKASTKPAQSSPSSSSAQTSQSKDDKSSDRAASQQPSSGASAGASSSAGAAGMAGGMSVRKLRGMDVVDAQGKDLGEIDEVMLDMQGGRVHAVVLGFGGFLGLGEKHFAFAVSDLQPAKDKDKLQLNVDKDKLKDREGFAKGKYPGMDDPYWTRIGQGGDKAGAAAGATGQKANLMRASQVIGKDVQDKSGKDVGEVQDIILSSDHTRIQHVVIDVEGAAGHATVEPRSLSMASQGDKKGDKLVIDMSADQLKSQAKPADMDKRSERTRPVTSGSAAAGGTAGAAAGAAGSTTRTVPVERDKEPKADSKASDSKASGSASGGASTSAGSSGMKQDDKQAQSSAGSASAGAGASKKSFSELDKDNDGSLSQMEAAADANAKSNFEKLDKNNDKKLSRSEYEGGQGAAAGATGGSQDEQKDKSK